MQQLKRLSLIVLVIAASGITATYAQTIFGARPIGHYSRAGMYKLSKMSEPEEVSGCDRVVLVGTVDSAAHNDKNEIVNFAFENAEW